MTSGRFTNPPGQPQGFGRAEGLAVRITHAGGAIEMSLAGELDLSRTATLREELARAIERLERADEAQARLIVDLHELTFIDSSGIQVLVAAKRRCAQHGVELALRVGGSQVRRMLSLAGVAEFLGIAD